MEEVEAPVWMLAHCDSGVTWGVVDGEGNAFRLGSHAFPSLCPRPTAETLQELRLFWQAGEVLLWRSGSVLRGRLLLDAEQQEDPGRDDHNESLRPDDEDRLLLAGSLYEKKGGFARVGNGTGAEQALPIADGMEDPPQRLRARHYFAGDEKTGAVKVVATRLVALVPCGEADH